MIFSLFNADLSSCNGQESNFIDKILSDFSDNSFHLKLTIAVDKIPKTVIIENDDFYMYVKNQKNLDKAAYSIYVKNLLIGKEILTLNTSELVKWGFITPHQEFDVHKRKAEGKNKFLEYYFNSNKVVKEGFEQPTQFNLIEILFDWQLVCKFDDETGYLIFKQFNY